MNKANKKQEKDAVRVIQARWAGQPATVIEKIFDTPSGCYACRDGVREGHFQCSSTPAWLCRLEDAGLVARQYGDTRWSWYIVGEESELQAVCKGKATTAQLVRDYAEGDDPAGQRYEGVTVHRFFELSIGQPSPKGRTLVTVARIRAVAEVGGEVGKLANDLLANFFC